MCVGKRNRTEEVQPERVGTTWFGGLVAKDSCFELGFGPLCPAEYSKMQLCGHRKKSEKADWDVSVRMFDVFATKLNISHEPCV